MSKTDRALQALWDEIGAPAGPDDARAFSLMVMEKIASRRLVIDLAVRFAIVVALLVSGWAVAPALGGLTTAFAAGAAAGLVNIIVLALGSGFLIAAIARRWAGRRRGV